LRKGNPVRISIMLCLFVTATVSASQTATKPYAQVIVDEMVLRNPGLAMLSIAISDAATTSTKVIASTDTSAVGMTDTDGSSGTMANIANQRCKAVVPLQDVGGAAIGSFEAELKGAGASTKAACLEQATGLRNDLA